MKKALTRLAFAATLALTLLASTGNAFAKDIPAGRETAWTVGPAERVWQLFEPVGVTWEE